MVLSFKIQSSYAGVCLLFYCHAHAIVVVECNGCERDQYMVLSLFDLRGHRKCSKSMAIKYRDFHTVFKYRVLSLRNQIGLSWGCKQTHKEKMGHPCLDSELMGDWQVHVSTAYCNCDRSQVKEVIYPPPIGPDQIVSLVEALDEDLVDSLTPKLVGNRPNTYTFTKALAECWLQDNKGDLPLVIVRPSIVISSMGGPLTGWVDNWNGPTGELWISWWRESMSWLSYNSFSTHQKCCCERAKSKILGWFFWHN